MRSWRSRVLPLMLLAWAGAVQALPKCLFLSSYHPEYEWNKGIERGVETVLAGKCEIKKFYMDTQRNPQVEFGQAVALKAKAWIEAEKPDVVIASDDAASRYVVAPYYKNATLPFVFCGINWTVEEYGYPFDNATGMIEVTPAQQVIVVLQQVVGSLRRGLFLSGDNYSDRKDFKGFSLEFKARNIALESAFVSDMEQWEQAFVAGQDYDFLIVHNNTNIKGWNDERAVAFQAERGRRFALTLNRWMMPFSMFGVFKIPEEQGEWAAQIALAIIAGAKPRDIPITPNRRWDMMANEATLERAGVAPPLNLLHEAASFHCESVRLCPSP
ncbi:MAG: ABC transporter substrate-binding protein [Gammaproteobacteria bacterium]|nr:ABC transporter substrate-binding protein [Gammaproteobacteria bacterium]